MSQLSLDQTSSVPPYVWLGRYKSGPGTFRCKRWPRATARQAAPGSARIRAKCEGPSWAVMALQAIFRHA